MGWGREWARGGGREKGMVEAGGDEEKGIDGLDGINNI